MRIRPASPQDVPSIKKLSAQLGYPVSSPDSDSYLQEIQEDTDHSLFVAESEGGAIVGWIHVYKTKRVFTRPFSELGGLVVDENSRNRGLGRELLIAAEDWAVRHGCSCLLIRSGSSRTHAHEFYEKAGYEALKQQEVFQKKL